MMMTPEEFDTIQEWDELYRYELVRGVLIVSPLPGPAVSFPNDELSYRLQTYRNKDSQGSALNDTCYNVYLKTPDSRRRLDRAVWCGLNRAADLRYDVPTIAIEFVADSARDRRRDYIEKRAEYAEIGVKEYWVIDRFRRTLTVFTGTDGETVHEETAVVTTPLLPGFELDLKRLLAIADRAAS